MVNMNAKTDVRLTYGIGVRDVHGRTERRLLDNHATSRNGRSSRGCRGCLHGLNNGRWYALLVHRNDVLHSYGCSDSRAMDVVEDKLLIDSGAAHRDHFLRGGNAWCDLPAKLRGNDGSVLSSHFVHLSSKNAAGQRAESRTNGSTRTSASRLTANDCACPSTQ